jgi:KTSC domain
MPDLTHIPTSSHIRRLTYNPESERLAVAFSNGSTYHHAAVPAHVFAQMTRHPSAGEYYHKVIKKHYKLLGKVTMKETDDSNQANATD